MSRRNGDRALFQKQRGRKMLRRQRTRALRVSLLAQLAPAGSDHVLEAPGRPGPALAARAAGHPREPA